MSLTAEPVSLLSPAQARALTRVGEQLAQFRDERDWRHLPVDLAASVLIEAGELVELYQWTTEMASIVADPDAVSSEVADVLIYAAHLADRLGVALASLIVAGCAGQTPRSERALAFAVADKAGGLLSLFDPDDEEFDARDGALALRVRYLSDVMSGAWALAGRAGFDPVKAMDAKMTVNTTRFPAAPAAA